MIPCLALAACSSGPGTVHPAAVQTTTTSTTSVANVEVQFSSDLSTQAAANSTYNAALAAATTDLNKQNQQIAQDQSTIQNGEDGTGCTISLTDPSSYESCLSSEEQTEASANTNETAAESQATQDLSQYASAANIYEQALSTFIGQLIGLSWPSQYNEAVNDVVDAARTYRGDLATVSGISTSTPMSQISAINSQLSTDVGNFNDAISALKAQLSQAPT